MNVYVYKWKCIYVLRGDVGPSRAVLVHGMAT
jgi:hypothetical protein